MVGLTVFPMRLRRVPPRVLLLLLPAALLLAGALAWLDVELVFMEIDAGPVYGGVFLFIGLLPFWAIICLVVGLVLALLLLAVRDVGDVLLWAAPLFFVMWMLGSARLLSINPRVEPTDGWLSWLTAGTSITAQRLGLVLFVLVVVAIAVGSRLRRS